MFSFRRADVSEINAIQKIAEETWPQTYDPILGKDQVRFMLDTMYSKRALESQFEHGHYFYFIYNGNNLIGFAGFEILQDNKCKLHKIYILPSQQGVGAGSALLNFIINKARSLGTENLLLNVNKINKARYFYQKMGFVIKDEIDIPIGNNYFMNDYVMSLSLIE